MALLVRELRIHYAKDEGLNMAKCSLIVLNYNGSHDTIEMIDSVFTAEKSAVDIVIVDGDSPKKDELHLIQEHCSKKYNITFFAEKYSNKRITSVNKAHLDNGSGIVLIQANNNYGFAIGSNIGIEYALERNTKNQYIALLNNDTVVTKEFLTKVLLKMESNNIDAAMGTILYYGEDPEYIWSIGGYIKWRDAAGIHLHKNERFNRNLISKNDIVMREFVSGCYTVFTKAAIKEIGLLDEAYFFGAEEYQYSIDLKKKNMKMAWIPEAIIYHKSKLDKGNGNSHSIVSSEWQYNSYIDKILLINKNRNGFYRLYWRCVFILYINLFAKKRNKHAKNISKKQWKYMKKQLVKNIRKRTFTISDFLEYKRGLM